MESAQSVVPLSHSLGGLGDLAFDLYFRHAIARPTRFIRKPKSSDPSIRAAPRVLLRRCRDGCELQTIASCGLWVARKGSLKYPNI
jgi:hypothetical protein